MVTIGGGILLGLDAVTAAEFSFLLGLPTLGAACAYDLLKNFKHAADTGAPNMFQVLGAESVFIGIAVAASSAAVAVRWLVGMLTRRGLAPFGWYRLGLAAVLGSLMAAGIVRLG
jgi:undecaprenyl-diphosphatase